MMAHKRKTNHAYSLNDPGPHKTPSFTRVALEFGGDMWSLNQHTSDDDEHAYKR